MDYEKMYKAALKTATQWIKDGCSDKEKICLESIFPELRESEDEKIRKELLDAVDKARVFDIDKDVADRWTAWLEKQKVPKHAPDDLQKSFEAGQTSIVENPEQYGLCKKAESEDEKIRKEIIHYILYKASGVPEKQEHEWVSYLERQKECVADSSKTSAEEDESIRKFLVDYFTSYKIGNVATKLNGVRIDDILNYLEKQKEQKPVAAEDMPYVTDEHFYEREPVDSFKYKLAEYMTRSCTKKEGPYGYEYGISAETILKMAEEELLKRGVVQKPAEWNEDTLDEFTENIRSLITRKLTYHDPNGSGISSTVFIDDETAKDIANGILFYVGKEAVKNPHREIPEWSEEDKEMLNSCISSIEESKENRYAYKETDGDTSYDREVDWLKSLRPQPHWKPNENQMSMLLAVVNDPNNAGSESCHLSLKSLYNDLKKL